jgi:PPM family protein phosphatase
MKRVEHAHLSVLAHSHAGMRGKNNEDRYGVSAFRMADKARTPALLAVLADGIGGHRAGEVAAELAVDLISASMAEDGDSLAPQEALQQAIHTASQVIYEQSRSNDQQEGMGATCACVFIVGLRLYTASVGDSRIYLLRNGVIHQLTIDHTWVQEALEKGVIAPEQVQGHPNAHVIRRFLGSPEMPEADIRMRLNGDEDDTQAMANQGIRLKTSDVLLLCSDGLTDLVNDAEIAEELQSQALDLAVPRLIDLANQRGGHDNITLITIKVPPGIKELEKPKRHLVKLGCLAVFVVAVLAAGVALGVPGLFGQDTPTPTVETIPLTGLTFPPPGQETPGETLMAETPGPTSLPVGVNTFTPGAPTVTTFLTPEAATLTPWPTNTGVP